MSETFVTNQALVKMNAALLERVTVLEKALERIAEHTDESCCPRVHDWAKAALDA